MFLPSNFRAGKFNLTTTATFDMGSTLTYIIFATPAKYSDKGEQGSFVGRVTEAKKLVHAVKPGSGDAAEYFDKAEDAALYLADTYCPDTEVYYAS